MHIAFTTPQFGELLPGQGGIETLVIGWATELTRRGHRVTVASLSSRDQVVGKEFWTAVETTSVEGLRYGNPDVLISNNRTHHRGDFLFMHNPPGFPEGAAGEVPWPPTGTWKEGGRLLAASGTYLESLRAVGDSNLVVCSNWLADRIEGLTGRRGAVVHPHADPAYRAAVRPTPATTPVVQYVGRLVWRKGLADLVGMAGAGLLPGVLRVTDYAHVSEPKHVTAIRRLLLEAPNVELVPAASSPEAVAELMAAADVLAVPSREEAFGMVSVEAQAAGTPVVAYDDGGLPETTVLPGRGLLLARAGAASQYAALLHEAVGAGPLTPSERDLTAEAFSVARGVDRLLEVVAPTAAGLPRQRLGEDVEVLTRSLD